jgi:hypothetical protein
MSTIVNARDVLLQATVPRVLAALLPGNLTVASTNVTGFPDFYSSVRSVEISATNQVFVSTTIAGVTPSSIVLTANLNNILGAVTWSIVSGSATFSTGTNTLSIANSGMTANVVVVQASVTSNGITYTDQMTVVKVVEGSSTVTAFLTNETASVAALAAGNVLTYAYSGGTYKVFSGSTEVTGTAVTYSVVSSTSVSATVATTGIYTITNMVADSASFVIRAVYAGTTIDKTYSVVKSKSTFNGDAGVRGTVNIAGAITASVWSDASAVLVISNSGYGVPQTRDIVTLYNTSTNYSESKFYNGTNWLSLDAYVNGNLLVTGTVVADKIAASSITADKIATGVITADKMVAGTITAASAIIADAAITTAKIANLAVQTAQIDNLSITTGKIANLAVQTAQIDTAAITTAKIGNLQVDTLQIAGNAVTLASSGKVTSPSSGGYASAITTSSGGPIFISGFAQKAATNNVITLSLFRGAPPTSGGTLIASASAGVSSATSVALNFVDQPGTGTQSYYLRVNSSDAISYVTLFTLETKK